MSNPLMPKGYYEWTLPRPDGSAAHFYSSFDHYNAHKPLLIWAQGSGYNSLFPVREGRARQGSFSIVRDLFPADVQCVSVEKRGVAFGQLGQGSAANATQEYLEHATLEERCSDISLVLAAYRKSGLPAKILMVGHSEGADVAAALSADEPEVTHVGFLAGGGASQLFDLMTLIRKSSKSEADKETEIAQLWKDWAAIQTNPRSTKDFFMGHAYRRWSSFVTRAPIDSLLKTRAKILIVQGTDDTSVPIESADLSAVELSRHRMDFEYLRIVGADHSMRTPEQKTQNAIPFESLGTMLRNFFLGDAQLK